MKHYVRPCLFSSLCVALLTTSIACSPTPENPAVSPPTKGTGEQVGEYIDDSVITAKVKAKLIDDPDLSAAEINVETYKGLVQLSGFVKDPTDIAKADEVARTVKGVQGVRNDIRLKQPAN